ncbi:RsmB/NOP family class I SAM-dependent RNA methyltransferase [uncultured Paracoccus sp.]|uniref:RsmB/NOP family class I SAM-dependent RNA methyltransferase n=1 Tax=uncultured Paracoccus sp. TaxID=189685 RepID=UPI00262139EC|nr:RsmB/NOP family class I SAM-dependent RNA methyltransferase [uncultured Paracoccus sp.]
MTPQARVAAAIGILDEILAGAPAEQALLRWSRASRFAGSGDRAGVRDLVFDALRQRESLAALGGALNGRGLMLGRARSRGEDAEAIFTGEGHAPATLSPEERAAGRAPDAAQAMNLPDWVQPLWAEALGADAGPVAAAMADRAPVWLRVNARKADAASALAALAGDGIEAEADDRLPSALRVTAGERRINNARAYLDGLVELQDLSPQLACAALPVADGQRVLDFCAGGGGKALAVGARARVTIDAHDADPDRMADLPARAARAGITIRSEARPKGPYDLVIADVPCSGSGTWRRTPDAKWRLQPGDLARLQGVQAGIMDQVAGLVRPGGHLAYMTCSLFDAENGDQVRAFLDRHPDFAQAAQQRWTPLEASDGFFLALFQRQE